MSDYLGVSPEAWSLIFDGIQAASIFAGITFGGYQLRNLQRQRSAGSYEKMFGEWRKNLPTQRQVLARMPMHDGTISERAVALAQAVAEIHSSGNEVALRELNEIMGAARDVVHTLNDLGTLVERGVVRQEDFFRQFHYRISELVYLLEPYILLISTVRRGRWGLRLIRLGVGAKRYHQASKVDSYLPLSVRNRVIVMGTPSPRFAVLAKARMRHGYIPSREELAKDVDPLMREIEVLLDAAGDPNLSLEALRALFDV